MQYSELGRTGLQVSRVCLGTMTWGQQNTEAEGHAQMDLALERAGQLLDTAEMYAVPPKPETKARPSGSSAAGSPPARARRDKVVLAHQDRPGAEPMSWLRDAGGEGRQTAAQIDEAVEKSLRRLQDRPHRPVPARTGLTGPLQPFGGMTYRDYGEEEWSRSRRSWRR
jgi:aryl-alcohol dehydrogenase-like predicted oxidoreductase